jgi:DNA-binding NarL/FixJ family response regulator
MRPTNPYIRRYLTPRPDLVTERERAIGALLASGLEQAEVAERLGVTVRTVSYDRSNLYRKLRLAGVVDLTHYAIARRWIKVRGRRGPGGKLRT